MGGKPACQNTLLLVAAAQQTNRLFGVRRLDVQRLDEPISEFDLLRSRNIFQTAAVGLQRKDDVFTNGKVRDDRFDFSVLRTETEFVLHRLTRRLGLYFFA